MSIESPKPTRLGKLKKWAKENARLAITLLATSGLFSQGFKEPIKTTYDDTKLDIAIALADMPGEEKEKMKAEVEVVRERRKRRYPYVLAYEKELENFFKEARQVFDGSKDSIKKAKGKFSPRNFLHRYEQLVFGVSPEEVKIAEAGTDALIQELKEYALDTMTVDFADQVSPIILTNKNYDKTRSLTLDSMALRFVGVEKRRNCEAGGKDWLIALTEIYPEIASKIHVQDFFGHIRALIEIDGKKYVLEGGSNGKIPLFPDAKSQEKYNQVMPLASYFAKLLGKPVHELEGVEYFGDPATANDVTSEDKNPLKHITDSIYNPFESPNETQLGFYGSDPYDADVERDEQAQAKLDAIELMRREMLRAESPGEIGSNEHIVRRNIQQYHGGKKGLQDLQKRLHGSPNISSLGKGTQHQQDRTAGDEEPKKLELPELAGKPVEEPVQEEKKPEKIEEARPIDIDAAFLAKQQELRVIELDLLKEGKLDRKAAEDEVNKFKQKPTIELNFNSFTEVTLEGLKIIADRIIKPHAANQQFFIDFSRIQKFPSASFKILNEACKSTIRCVLTIQPDAFEADLITEIKDFNRYEITFTGITPSLVNSLKLLKAKGIQLKINFPMEQISIENAKLFLDIPFDIVFTNLKSISDEAAQILLQRKEKTAIGHIAVSSYWSAKLNLKDQDEDIERNPSAFIGLLKLKPDVARAFGESGIHNFYVSAKTLLDAEGIRELIRASNQALTEKKVTRKILTFDKRISIAPNIAAEFQHYQGQAVFELGIFPPQTARAFAKSSGTLQITGSIGEFFPEESLDMLIHEHQDGLLWLTLLNVDYKNLIKKIETKNNNSEILINGSFTFEDLEIIANYSGPSTIEIFGEITNMLKVKKGDTIEYAQIFLEDFKFLSDSNPEELQKKLLQSYLSREGIKGITNPEVEVVDMISPAKIADLQRKIMNNQNILIRDKNTPPRQRSEKVLDIRISPRVFQVQYE